ncbi:MAG: DUF2520 domain-containing protein [Chitinophagales bacterium]|nr:DUF2520 domain-containing protein [Bacteroidota bacterium]MBP7398263.1 DUF2520 domain-containing protein [Chitinophagales bacterium]MBP8752945.1 DUF2520 domain-containing protein [Chitinophagales bacterium]MBP9188563.1 DUF2520 domain-containing protein [Chitinophagales bacterium]MBP9547943.1 DUF2520 domain-containing protein [Chitinophagales bacterium]
MSSTQISIVGTGNIAWHLVQMFCNAGLQIQHIYGREFKKASALANICNATAKQLKTENSESNNSIVFFAVADDAIREVASTFNVEEIVSVHVSGAVESKVLHFEKNQFGVYYPLQSFSKEVHTNYNVIPVCIVAQDKQVELMLIEIANKISNSVCTISDAQKSKLHLAAVIVNNFTNFLYGEAFRIIEEAGLEKNILFSLMQETIEKLRIGSPAEMQTGPARRGDVNTMQKHHALLKSNPELMKLYDVLSNSIQNKFLDN